MTFHSCRIIVNDGDSADIHVENAGSEDDYLFLAQEAARIKVTGDQVADLIQALADWLEKDG